MRVKQVLVGSIALAAVSACTSQVPDSGAYGRQYEQQQVAREAQLANTSGVIDARMGAVSTATTPITQPVAVTTQALPSATTSTLPDTYAAPQQQVVVAAPLYPVSSTGQPLTTTVATDRDVSEVIQASPSNAAPVLLNNPASLSDEQDFSAVSSRESIESDAERLARNAAQYQVVAPTAIPERTNAGPNVISYALNAPNHVGQEWYSRFVLSGAGRAARNCAKYGSPELAQEDFLRRGGPERDPRGIDPDGDGFVCGWDPAPIKLAAMQARSAGN